MCVLIVCRNPGASHPLLVAANREEDPKRATSPPGLHVVHGSRALCPFDRRHGGTWAGINENCVVAALTNWVHGEPHPDAESRGRIGCEALAGSSARDAIVRARRLAARGRVRPFQLVAADAHSTFYLRGSADPVELEDHLVVLTNRFPPGEVEIPGLESWLEGLEGDVEAWLDHLLVVCATGNAIHMPTGERIRVCVEHGSPRTVSTTLIAAPHEPSNLRLHYVDGSPRTEPVHDYSALAHRLVDR